MEENGWRWSVSTSHNWEAELGETALLVAAPYDTVRWALSSLGSIVPFLLGPSPCGSGAASGSALGSIRARLFLGQKALWGSAWLLVRGSGAGDAEPSLCSPCEMGCLERRCLGASTGSICSVNLGPQGFLLLFWVFMYCDIFLLKTSLMVAWRWHSRCFPSLFNVDIRNNLPFGVGRTEHGLLAPCLVRESSHSIARSWVRVVRDGCWELSLPGLYCSLAWPRRSYLCRAEQGGFLCRWGLGTCMAGGGSRGRGSALPLDGLAGTGGSCPGKLLPVCWSKFCHLPPGVRVGGDLPVWGAATGSAVTCCLSVCLGTGPCQPS